MSTCIRTHFSSMTLEDMVEQSRRQSEIANSLTTEKGMPFLTAYIVAGDIMSGEKADAAVAAGVPAIEVYGFVGSYTRFDWCVKNLDRADLLQLLPELWVAADPDDTNPEYLTLWQDAFAANQGIVVDDATASLKTFFNKQVTVYRGQVGDALGISWTLNLGIAEKFARTGGGRQKVDGGKVLTGKVHRSKILAYLTSRDEFEVIVDPKDVQL